MNHFYLLLGLLLALGKTNAAASASEAPVAARRTRVEAS